MFNADNLKNENYFIAEIDGKKCLNLESFLEQIGIAFKFPDYYGKNINALWDCLGDLSWLNETNYSLIVRNATFFLKEENEKTKQEIIDLLSKIVDDWKNVPNFDGEDEFRKRSDFKIIFE